MKRLIGVLLVAAMAGFGAWAGSQMGAEAMGVVVGFVLGFACVVPVSIGILLASSRKRKPREYPPAIVRDHERGTWVVWQEPGASLPGDNRRRLN